MIICSIYIKKLRENLDTIHNNYIKKEMNIELDISNTKDKIHSFTPMIMYGENTTTWYLLEDLRIQISLSNLDNLKRFVDYMEEKLTSKPISLPDTLIKKVILGYITSIGL